MLIAHGPLATLSTKVILEKDLVKASGEKKALIYLVAFIAGVLPDFDFFYLIANSQPTFLHHELITHTPIFWIGLYFVTRYLYKLILGKRVDAIELSLKAFLIGSLSHFVVDAFVGHIKLFYPIYSKGITLFSDILPVNVYASYELHPVFMLEIGIILYFLLFVYKNFRSLTAKWVTSVILTVTVVAIIFSTVLHLKVHQYDALTEDNRNMPIYDTDHDGVRDLIDYDIGNTGRNNLLTVEPEALLETIEDLKQSKGVVVPFRNRSFSESVLYSFGALDSSRMIFQSYIEVGKPIGPVLKLEYYESNERNTAKLLLNYLQDTEQLIVSDAIVPGKIVFFLEGDTIINLGISDRDSNILTVLDNHKPKAFTLEEILGYHDEELTVLIQN